MELFIAAGAALIALLVGFRAVAGLLGVECCIDCYEHVKKRNAVQASEMYNKNMYRCKACEERRNVSKSTG